ncbi:MAG: single-stranded-DNA-specific exonuclease RecJ [Clostridia bacterium]|nr:single-stranded-DNA-specific exonuclease RecJ [Clostridia bacterium]
MQKVNWNFKDNLIEPRKISEFSKKYKISHVMSVVLLNRGIETEEQVKSYISKSLESVNNPNLLPDMEKAAKRITEAIEKKEKIMIYGDYDVDGVTSTSLLYSFLKDMGADVDYFIPDRIKDGYGLNILAVNKISKKGTKLIITVDCGISSFGEVELAKAQKMDVIITDHHSCREKIPQALAVVNPKRAHSQYPFNALAGVGVAFKLILAVAMDMGLNTRECFDKYVEFAAIGTVADVVSLQGENRVIVHKGIQSLAKSNNFGLNALLKIAGSDGKGIDSTTIAFMLSPRLNAAGRMGNAKLAVDLLLSKSEEEAYGLAVKLDETNKQRQKTELEIFREAVKMIEEDPDKDNKKVIVLAREGWHHGVIGIVASRILEIYYKPCIIIACDGNIGKGSGRSVEGINLFDALTACEDLLTQYGGHAQAAGLSLNMDNFDAFVKKINKYVSDNIKTEPVKTLNIDCTVPSGFISIDSARQMSWLEPFGEGNEKPVFAVKGARVVSASAIGADGKHLRLRVDISGKITDAVGFGFGEYAKYLNPDRVIDIAFNLDINNFMNNEKVQLIIKDIKSRKM